MITNPSACLHSSFPPCDQCRQAQPPYTTDTRARGAAETIQPRVRDIQRKPPKKCDSEVDVFMGQRQSLIILGCLDHQNDGSHRNGTIRWKHEDETPGTKSAKFATWAEGEDRAEVRP